MRAFVQADRQKSRGFVSALACGLLAASLALASPAFAAGGGGGGGGAAEAARALEAARVEEPAAAQGPAQEAQAPGALAAEAPERVAEAAVSIAMPNLARRFPRTSRFAIPARSGTGSITSAS